MLKITGLTKKYDKKTAVDNLSLSIAPGEIYGFIGHNGAGKTTTLRACTGILTPDSGEILVDGVSVLQNPIEAKKRIAYIPDNPDLYDFLTGMQYLVFIADIFGVPADVRKERIDTLSTRLAIRDDLMQPISTYSHGMKQKVAVIAAFLHEPRLLIMDEPFVGLDPMASHTIKEMMRELCDRGSAIFFSTHVLDVAEKLCDKIAIIKEGKLLAAGTMDEVKGDSSLEEAFLGLGEDRDV